MFSLVTRTVTFSILSTSLCYETSLTMILATLNKKNLFLYQWDVCKMYNICGLVLLTAQAGQGRWLPLPKSVLLKVFLLKKSSSFLLLPIICSLGHWGFFLSFKIFSLQYKPTSNNCCWEMII